MSDEEHGRNTFKSLLGQMMQHFWGMELRYLNLIASVIAIHSVTEVKGKD